MLATPTALADLLNQASIRAVYQPIVELDTGRAVGFEALARGPVGSVFASPMNLLDAARAEDRLAEVDWLCRAAAIRGALDIGLRRPHARFVNVEPAAIAAPAPDEIGTLLDRAAGELRIVVEITERALHAVAPDTRTRSRSWVPTTNSASPRSNSSGPGRRRRDPTIRVRDLAPPRRRGIDRAALDAPRPTLGRLANRTR